MQVFFGGRRKPIRSSGDAVVKLLACGVRGMMFDSRFDSRFRRYDFRDSLSPASKSRYG